jgi:putative ABC transport system permease protein
LMVSIDAGLYFGTIFMMIILSMLSAAWIARRTMRQAIVVALAHN